MPRRRKPNRDFHFVDVHVGKKLRLRRELARHQPAAPRQSRRRRPPASGEIRKRHQPRVARLPLSLRPASERSRRLFLRGPDVCGGPDADAALTHGPARQRLSAPGNHESRQGLLRDQRPRPPPRRPSLDPVDERNVAILTTARRRARKATRIFGGIDDRHRGVSDL